MSNADQTKALRALLKKLDGRHKPAEPIPAEPVAPDPTDPVLHQLVYSFLLWEATPAQAATALNKLLGAVVDYNELRICLADELSSIIGERYPMSLERAERLRACLNDVYVREHAVRLSELNDASKRDARTYLSTLDGIPQYVASRVLLLALGGHAMPVDSRMGDQLIGEGVADEGTNADDISSWLERQVKAADASETYLLLESWAATRAKRRAASRKSSSKTSSKRSSKKTTKKASSKKSKTSSSTRRKGTQSKGTRRKTSTRSKSSR